MKVKFKLKELEIEIEGQPSDIPRITDQLGEHVAGMLGPVASMADPESVTRKPVQNDAQAGSPAAQLEPKPKRKRTKKKTTSASSGGSQSEDIPLWRHEPDDWGSPLQSWTTRQKMIYWLYVAEKMLKRGEYSSRAMTASFNQMFKDAGAVHPPNVTRDLGVSKKASGSEPALVGEDVTQDPSCWYLTKAGKEAAEKLVSEAKGLFSGSSDG